MLTIIKGYNVGLYVDKPDGTSKRVLCANSITFEISTESVQTDCQDAATADGAYATSEPGQISWTAGTEMTVRQATNVAAVVGPPAIPAQTDATDNVTAENMLDYQLAGRKFTLRYQLGKEIGSAVYSGQVYITKNGFSGANKDNVKASVAFQGTGPLTKTLSTI